MPALRESPTHTHRHLPASAIYAKHRSRSLDLIHACRTQVVPTPSPQPQGLAVSPVPHQLATTPSFPVEIRPTPHQAKRAPRMGSRVDPSPLRPHVTAEDRLFAWDTPYAQDHRTHTGLPMQLARLSIITLLGGLAPNTRSTYGAGILRFTQFCDQWKICEHERMPAAYPLLTAFLASVSGKASDSTVRSWMAGLARSCTAREGAKFRKPPRAPVSIEHLVALRHGVDLSNPRHAAIWAAALTAFFGCRRLGEIVVGNTTKFSSKFNVCRSSPIRFRTFRDGSSSASFNIPWTKTTKEKGATVILTQRVDKLAAEMDLCPLKALRNHLAVNGDASIPESASLFAYKDGDSWKHLTRRDFLEISYAIWRMASLQYVSGHSFRIGGVVELLLAGVSPEVVAATGGWTSLAFLLYWRC